MAFRPTSDDIRDSRVVQAGMILRSTGGRVYSDEFAMDPTFVSEGTLIAAVDVVIWACRIRLGRWPSRRPRVVDLW